MKTKSQLSFESSTTRFEVVVESQCESEAKKNDKKVEEHTETV